MAANKLQWRRIAKGDKLPCQSFLRKKNGEILKLSTGAGIKVGQDAYYLPVDDVIEEIKNYPIEESEDEKMRRELVERFSHIKGFDWYGLPIKDILAWLEKQGESTDIPTDAVLDSNKDGLIADTIRYKREKQGGQKHQYISRPKYIGEEELLGEQKPADKVEPKFKAGDWVVDDNGRTGRIIECTKDFADVDLEFSCLSTRVNNIRSWTIQDAKDGDVLATLDYILVFKEFLKNDGGISYCHYDFGAGNPQFIWFEDKNWYFGKEAIIHPATKEQRALLFQKMHEAGYEWNAEKLELKKIEQKLAWSEEDEENLYHINALIKDSSLEVRRQEYLSNWLKSLKDRVQPRPTWKPSDEHYELEEFAKIVRGNLTGISIAVQKLFEAKYLQLTGNKMYGGFKD